MGQAGSGKSTALFKDCINRAEKDFKKSFLVIVPEQVSNSVTERLIKESDRKGILNIDVLSFQRLAHRIFDNAGGDDREIIDDTGKSLILRRVISENIDKLKALKKSVLKPGYVKELKSVISEFVQYEVTPEDILKAAEKQGRPFIREKLKDIALLYRVFREVTGEKFVTREELLDRAADSARRARFLNGAEVFLDDFTGFTPIQYRFLESLFPLVDAVSLCLDYDGEDGDLFALSVSTIAKVRSIASDAGFETETIRLYDSEETRHRDREELRLINDRLFRRKREKQAGEITALKEDDRGRVRIVKCDTPEKESVFIIHEIMRLVREEGLRYRDIAVVLSDPETYGMLLLSEAEKQGVPLFLDFTTELILNPYTEFIRSAMEAAKDDLRYDSVFNLIRTGLTGIEREEADILENYVRALNIRGRKRYGKEFSYRTKNLKDEELLIINSAREKVFKLLSPLLEISGKKKRAEEFTDVLEEFLEKSRVAERIEIITLKAERENRESEASILRQAVGKTEIIIKKIRELLSGEKMTFGEYLEVLVSGLESVKVGTLPPGMDTVRAGDMKRSRYNDIKVLIFAGMNDGLIPAVGAGAGLLSEFDREYLRECDVSLSPNPEERTDIEKLYFYMNVTSPSERLCLTYSEGNSEGRALKPSCFLSEITDILPGVKTEYIAEEDSRSRLYTGADALFFLNKYLKDYESRNTAAEIYASLSDNETFGKAAKDLVDRRFKIKGSDRISEAVSALLYGEKKGLSPTRLEKFASCALKHFLSNGLRLEEREEFTFERKDLGSVLHGVLNDFGLILQSRGIALPELKDKEAEDLISEALTKYLEENESLVLNDNERNKYYIFRISRILRSSVKILKEQISSGSFLPSLFESPFNAGPFYGRIDRIDIAGKDDRLYLSVIDYKSGNKAFDLSRIYFGLDLQLMIYLQGAINTVRKKYPGKEVIPAGIFYYHIDDPVLNEDSIKTGDDTELRSLRLNACRLRGMVNSDMEAVRLFDRNFEKKSLIIPVELNRDGGFSAYSNVVSASDFDIIYKHVMGICDDFIKRIGAGETEPKPVLYEGKTACEYCEYQPYCRAVFGDSIKCARLIKPGNLAELLKLFRGK